MVATLLRLRFRILINSLRGSVWQLVGFIAGALWAVMLLGLVAIGLFFAGMHGVETARYAVLAGGAVLTLGWVLGPLFAAGIDTTLDPARLAVFPLPMRTMMIAITAGGVTGIPGIATTLGGLATFAAWFRWPLAAAAALIAVPLGVLICVVASRVLTSVLSGVTGGRRARELIGAVVFALLILAGPLFAGAQALIRAGSAAAGTTPAAALTGVLEAVSWTPIGAAWAVPGDIAAGAYPAALAKLLIAAATLALLWVLWRRSLEASLVAPASHGAKRVAAGKLGWFGRLPTGGVGAGWARSLTYWLHDPRYLRQLLIVPLTPVFVLMWSRGDMTHGLLVFSATLIAFVLGIVPYADVSYDGTAFGTIMATGIRGRVDRLGRMLGAATVALPLTLVAAVVSVAVTGRWEMLTAVIGSAWGMLFTAYGVCAVSSALLIIPVPAPGDSPFKRVPGATFQILLAFLGIWVAAAILAAPGIVLAVLALTTGDPVYGWASLATGLLLGTALFLVGVHVGGRLLDRTAPRLLLTLRAAKAG